ncbi:MAG TPA: OmpA family protein [Spirochaetota bacterium]|nr:OmpA family protein [Spirochaetota bacterium]
MQKSRWIKKAAAGTALLFILTAAYLAYGQSVVFNNTGMLINTSGDDYSPSCTADGKTIVFSSRNEQESTHKIYTCTNDAGVWSEPYPVLEVSSESNDETPFISADGQILLFSSDRPGGYSPSATADNNKRITYDIYISRRVNGQWTLPEQVAGDVNSNMNERSPSLSSDGRTIFFTRFPYRNISKSVIYMASWDGGKFNDVKALPESVNSGNYELAFIPSYSRAGVYHFASRRSGGYGGWDIYSTTMSEKGFSDPVNAGSSVNSRFDDLYLAETAAITMFCSNRTGGFGGYDLYVSSAVKSAEDKTSGSSNAPSGIRLTVKDKTGGQLIAGAEVSVYRQSVSGEGNQAGRWEVLTCDSRGQLVINTYAGERWLMVKPSGKTHKGKTVRVKLMPGQVQDIELSAEKLAGGSTYKNSATGKNKDTSEKYGEVREQVQIYSTDGSGLPELKPVYFRFNSAEIRTEYIPVLHGIIEYLRKNPGTDVIIRGHADRRGSKKANYKISRLRAEKVVQYMKSMGIDESRIKIVSLGETDPQIHGGKYDDALNRRVEFEFENRGAGFPGK